jgi:hypothetical protein
MMAASEGENDNKRKWVGPVAGLADMIRHERTSRLDRYLEAYNIGLDEGRRWAEKDVEQHYREEAREEETDDEDDIGASHCHPPETAFNARANAYLSGRLPWELFVAYHQGYNRGIIDVEIAHSRDSMTLGSSSKWRDGDVA